MRMIWFSPNEILVNLGLVFRIIPLGLDYLLYRKVLPLQYDIIDVIMR